MPQFDESKHPRAEDGKFTEKGNGTATSKKEKEYNPKGSSLKAGDNISYKKDTKYGGERKKGKIASIDGDTITTTDGEKVNKFNAFLDNAESGLGDVLSKEDKQKLAEYAERYSYNEKEVEREIIKRVQRGMNLEDAIEDLKETMVSGNPISIKDFEDGLNENNEVTVTINGKQYVGEYRGESSKNKGFADVYIPELENRWGDKESIKDDIGNEIRDGKLYMKYDNLKTVESQPKEKPLQYSRDYDGLDKEFDVATPQETANLMGKEVEDNGKIYKPEKDKKNDVSLESRNANGLTETEEKILNTRSWDDETTKETDEYLQKNPELKQRIKNALDSLYKRNQEVEEYKTNESYRDMIDDDYQRQTRALEDFSNVWNMDTSPRDDFFNILKREVRNGAKEQTLEQYASKLGKKSNELTKEEYNDYITPIATKRLEEYRKANKPTSYIKDELNDEFGSEITESILYSGDVDAEIEEQTKKLGANLDGIKDLKKYYQKSLGMSDKEATQQIKNLFDNGTIALIMGLKK